MRITVLIIVCAIAAPLCAQAPATQPSAPPATQPATATVIPASDDAKLMQLAEIHERDPKSPDAKATVEGTVSSARESDTGKVFRVSFKEADPKKGFYFVYFPKKDLFREMQVKFGGQSGSGLLGKRIRVTGTVALYQGRPQMVITSPDQITLVP